MMKPTKPILDTVLNRSRSFWPVRNICAALATMLLLGGCETVPPESAHETAGYQEWERIAEASRMTAPPAPEFPKMRDFHAEEEAEALESAEPPLPQIPVSNVVLTHEMDVGVLLRALADAADLNILISNNVAGPVLVSLKRETRWDLLFTSITEAHGLHYELEDDLLRIYSIEDVTRNIVMEEALHNQLQAAEKRMRSEPMVIEMVRVHYGKIENIAESVRATMLSIVAQKDSAFQDSSPGNDRPRFMIKADNDTGQLIIHGVPDDISRARKLIQGLDQPAFQILIEASIVQANSDVARELGVSWGFQNAINGGDTIFGTTPRPDGFNSNFPAQFEAEDPGFIYGVYHASGSGVLQAELSALEKDGRLNIVSSPSITTLDQQTAVIESGEERPFVSAVGTGIAAFPQIEFKKAVMRLEVTPHVIDENWVKLDIDTKKEEFDDNRTVIIEGSIQTPILTRSAITSLYLADGQTTVIGGLSSETESDQVSGVPGLKNIPGIGQLFRTNSTKTNFNDTLIFITPHVLPQAGRE